MPLVSIITSAWNAERFAAETILSVQAQNLFDWELLIADDCSTDGTAALVGAFAVKDPHVCQITARRAVGRPGRAERGATSGPWLDPSTSLDVGLRKTIDYFRMRTEQ